MSEQKLNGNWKVGWALDLHTIKSVRRDDGSFDNTYTAIGEALFQLKSCNNHSKIDVLAGSVISFMKSKMASVIPNLSVMLPVPPSKNRETQPVDVIARKISDSLDIVLDENYLIKTRATPQLKNVAPANKKATLHGAFIVKDLKYENKDILLFDDLYGSGTTLTEITKTLHELGKIRDVYVVTLTKTRTG